MTQNNIRIAVTGGIGSGKSTVCRMIEELNYPVYSCDGIYSELLASPRFLKKLEEEFGSSIVRSGAVDRAALSAIVFSDNSKLNILNDITHPAIMEEAFKKMRGHRLSFLEVPLLFENGFEKLFDGVIVVLRDLNERIDAVVQRDNLENKEIENRINSQFDYQNYDFSEYYVIHNSGSLEDLKVKTNEILKKIENLK